jgi:hypothetical protein
MEATATAQQTEQSNWSLFDKIVEVTSCTIIGARTGFNFGMNLISMPKVETNKSRKEEEKEFIRACIEVYLDRVKGG